MISGIYKHKKTGKIYQVGGGIKVINTTNNQNGKEMIMYIIPNKPFEIYVKEKGEFEREFTLLKLDNNVN